LDVRGKRGLESIYEDIFMTCTYHQMLFRLSNQGGWDGQSILHAFERGELCRVLDGKSEGRTPLGRSWRRREDNIKLWGGVNLFGGLL
jgi:hypothetical protein